MFQWLRQHCKRRRKLRYFKRSNFKCPCCGVQADESLIRFTDAVRHQYGGPLIVNSAMRCDPYNKSVGGAENSQHKLGLAVDLHTDNQAMQDAVIKAAEMQGVVGIGRYRTFVHLDLRDGPPARWDNR